MKKPELVIMCGSSRCGKSSWIEANLKDTHIVCSFDRFKKALTNAWWTQSIHTDFKQNSWNMTYSFFEEITNQQLDVVLDSNNSFANRRALWIDSARRKGYSIRGVEIFTPLEKCIERSKEEFPIDFPDNHAERITDALISASEQNKINRIINISNDFPVAIHEGSKKVLDKYNGD